jgi:hypothetical protein
MAAKTRRKVLFGALLATIGFGAVFSAIENRAPTPAPAMLMQPHAPYPIPTEASHAKQASHAKPVSDNTCYTGPNGGRYRLVHGKKRYDC